jgi:hypothetical protein
LSTSGQNFVLLSRLDMASGSRKPQPAALEGEASDDVDDDDSDDDDQG